MSKLIDETGNKYGKLTVLEFVGNRKWKCLCECGNISYVTGSDLRKGLVKSCGCARGKNTWEDLSNQKFGRLTAKMYMGDSNWLCVCECGNEVVTKTDYLKTGHKKSCGCLAKERTPYIDYNNDERFSRLYRIWGHMKERCYRKNNDNYANYGGKGIKVCDEWKNDFGKFFLWAISNGYQEVDGEYKDYLSIDRIDSSKDYSPDNCRWITISENASRVSETNKQLEEINLKSSDELVQDYIQRKMEHNQEIQQEKQKNRSGAFFCRKPSYCTIRNYDGTKQFLFKSLKVASMFLEISTSSIYYRIKKKNGVLNDTWKIEKISKEQFDEIKEKGVEIVV